MEQANGEDGEHKEFQFHLDGDDIHQNKLENHWHIICKEILKFSIYAYLELLTNLKRRSG